MTTCIQEQITYNISLLEQIKAKLTALYCKAVDLVPRGLRSA